MGVLLVDNGDLSKQDKQIKFVRQAVSVSGKTVQLE